MAERCTVCKGTNVQRVMWVRVNTSEPIDDFWEDAPSHLPDTYCEDCGEHHPLEGALVETMEEAGREALSIEPLSADDVLAKNEGKFLIGQDRDRTTQG